MNNLATISKTNYNQASIKRELHNRGYHFTKKAIYAYKVILSVIAVFGIFYTLTLMSLHLF